jgi:hypothetical protein
VSPQNADRAASSAKQRTAELPPVPRASHPMTSKRPAPSASSAALFPRTKATPETPGPPGLTNREPIRRSA